jgi:hypothetical protein
MNKILFQVSNWFDLLSKTHNLDKEDPTYRQET